MQDKSNDALHMVSILRKLVREEIVNAINDEGLSEYQLDDRITEKSQEACDTFMSDNLDERIAEYVDSNIVELLEGRLTVTIG